MAQPQPNPFGALLRSWRERRKRSQLELALEAEVSSRHVSFLETGRSQPSREMVLRLAEVLDVPLRERNALLRAAGFADLYRETGLDEPSLASVKQALAFVLARHEPYAAVVLDGAFNVLLANEGATRLLGRFVVTPPQPPLNILRMLFAPEGARPFVENWEEVARTQLQRLRREAMAAPAESPVRRLYDELATAPGVPHAWHHAEVPDESSPFAPFVLARDGLRVRLFSTIACIGTPRDVTLHELRVETFFPADEESEAVVRALASE